MSRGIGYPDFGFPGDFTKIAAHDNAIREGCYVDQADFGAGEEPGQFFVALAIYGAVARYCFDQDQPFALGAEKNRVGHFPMSVNCNAEFRQELFVEVAPLLTGITGVYKLPIGDEPASKIFDDIFDEFAMLPRAQRDFQTAF